MSFSLLAKNNQVASKNIRTPSLFLSALGIKARNSEQLRNGFLERILLREDYEVLLAEQFWDFAYIPFILLGYKVFKAEIDISEDRQTTWLDEAILCVFCRLFSAIRNGTMRIAEGSRPINIPMDIAIQCPDKFIFKRLLNDCAENINTHLLLKTSDVVKWALFEDSPLGETLLDVLGVYKNKKKTKSNSISKPEIYQIQFLSAAQFLWYSSPSKNKAEIFEDPILRNYGHEGGYSESRAYDLLSQIDPVGPKRGAGRPNTKLLKITKQEVGVQPIPGVWKGKKIDMTKAKIVIQTMVDVLKKLQNDLEPKTVKDHPIIKMYFQNRHPIIDRILSEWISEATYKSFPGFRTSSDEDLIAKYLLRLRVNLAITEEMSVESLPEEMKANILMVARYFESAEQQFFTSS